MFSLVLIPMTLVGNFKILKLNNKVMLIYPIPESRTSVTKELFIEEKNPMVGCVPEWD